jgi:hypothetical protein
MIRHIVLLRFTDESTEATRAALVEAFTALRLEIPGIVALESGVDVSPEGLAKGFTHCFMLSFESEAARDAYLPHPAHQAFVARLKPALADVLVFDYRI